MGYSIEYGLDGAKRTTRRQKKILPGTLAMCFCVMGVLVLLCFPPARQWVRELVIPGDADVTVAAAESFAYELEQGSGFAEALSVFCREVIVNGQPS